ncbi:MAG: hypothetical protein WCY22_03405 [Acholeplasmataceae bacterium]
MCKSEINESISYYYKSLKNYNPLTKEDETVIGKGVSEGDLPETLENDSDVVVINDKTYPGIAKEEQEKFLQKIPSADFERNSFVYNPKKNTVTLTGSIPNLANLKFQYTTDVSTPDGCYIFVNGMTLEQTTIKVLTTLRGYYDIWVKEWLDKLS